MFLKELLAKEERIKAGLLSADEARQAEYSERPIEEHRTDYIAYLSRRKLDKQRVKQSENYLRDDSSASRFRYLSDLNADKLADALDEQAAANDWANSTYNYHVEVWKAFGSWLCGKRIRGKQWSMKGEKRVTDNPFDALMKRDSSNKKR